jgi:hypothetical protein
VVREEREGGSTVRTEEDAPGTASLHINASKKHAGHKSINQMMAVPTTLSPLWRSNSNAPPLPPPPPSSPPNLHGGANDHHSHPALAPCSKQYTTVIKSTANKRTQHPTLNTQNTQHPTPYARHPKHPAPNTQTPSRVPALHTHIPAKHQVHLAKGDGRRAGDADRPGVTYDSRTQVNKRVHVEAARATAAHAQAQTKRRERHTPKNARSHPHPNTHENTHIQAGAEARALALVPRRRAVHPRVV